MALKKIDDKVFQSLKVWLQSPVFIDAHIPPEIRITFLQVLYLLVSAKDSLSKLKGETLNNFITDMIAQIATRAAEESKANEAEAAQESTDEKLAYIMLEDSMMLMTVQQLLQRDAGRSQIWENLATELSIENLVILVIVLPTNAPFAAGVFLQLKMTQVLKCRN